ncbi:hypothetical protein IW140_001592 [Coemansia sp. RSA 1813]|nr:hypothetical protein EV178_001647 [Coemansia sp. RSA 1646]KAJ1773431.1 hypothetical protein LPJ74_000684 [Coemansia sp. RSA 1843]KAJ2091315.1 hypothetical protein IW138_002014 [Coemansia sp. RSA 986]KAJ2216506.1 hypothetical protein EV179_001301 [Coemansia sp. RSA 487]KAJ2571412.1 hypothetical protein IW140_001592 [Coemansia sp. RSA 1813]
MAYKIIEFEPSTQLLNPNFEGYKLRLIDRQSTSRTGTEGAVRFFTPNTTPIEPRKLANNALLTYDEVYSRVHYNHLFCGPEAGSLVYIDGANNVQLVTSTDELKILDTKSIFTIPQHESDTALSGYPGVFCLSADVIIVFDGVERVYVLQRTNHSESEDTSQWNVSGVFEIGIGSIAAGASDDNERHRMYYVVGAYLEDILKHRRVIRLHYCYKISKEEERHSASTRGSGLGSAGAQTSQTTAGRAIPTFCIQAIQLDLPSCVSLDESHVSSIPVIPTTNAHTLHSHAIPVYCEYLPCSRYILGVKDGVVLDDTELDPQMGQQAAGLENMVHKRHPAPYYWMQTDSDVTVCIELPTKIGARQISCALSRSSLTIKFTDAAECTEKYTFDNTAFFDHIVADESVWTLENGNLLTVYLQKVHENARWPRVFGMDDGVLETMDPNEFAEIRDRLEKFTSDQIENVRARTGLVRQSADRALDQDNGGEEFDEEQSLDGGQAVIFSLRRWCTGQAEASSTGAAPDWLCSSFPTNKDTRLDKQAGNKQHQPRNGNSENSNSAQMLRKVCLKFDVDGVVFGINATFEGVEATEENPVEAKAHHMGTFAALAYIQASKREKRFMYVDADMRVAVLAESQRRVYIYHQTESAGAMSAVQNVIDLGSDIGVDGSGELLGVQLVGRVLVVLRRNSLCCIDLNMC